MDNKDIFASNLKKYMKLTQKSRNDISKTLGISYFTVSDWVNGKKYPRMDKVEMLANYFGIQMSDLIEENSESQRTPPKETLAEGEQVLIDLFRRVPEEKQQIVLEMIKAALKGL